MTISQEQKEAAAELLQRSAIVDHESNYRWDRELLSPHTTPERLEELLVLALDWRTERYSDDYLERRGTPYTTAEQRDAARQWLSEVTGRQPMQLLPTDMDAAEKLVDLAWGRDVIGMHSKAFCNFKTALSTMQYDSAAGILWNSLASAPSTRAVDAVRGKAEQVMKLMQGVVPERSVV